MSWSSDKEAASQPSGSTQPSSSKQFISELLDQNSQLFELLNEQRQLAKSVNASVQQQQRLNEANGAVLTTLSTTLPEQIAGFREALPAELNRQISSVYDAATAWVIASEQGFAEALDRQREQAQATYNRFSERLDATTAEAETRSTQAVERLDALTAKAEHHSRIRNWITTGLLAVLYAAALVVLVSVLISGGAAAAISDAAANIGGAGGSIFQIGVQWVLPLLVVGVPLAVLAVKAFTNTRDNRW